MKTKFILFTMLFSFCASSVINAATAVCTCNKKDSKGNNIMRYADAGFTEPTGYCQHECKNYGGLKAVSTKK